MARISKSLQRFRADETGNLAVVFSMGLVPIVLAVGMATDYGSPPTTDPRCRAPWMPQRFRSPHCRKA